MGSLINLYSIYNVYRYVSTYIYQYMLSYILYIIYIYIYIYIYIVIVILLSLLPSLFFPLYTLYTLAMCVADWDCRLRQRRVGREATYSPCVRPSVFCQQFADCPQAATACTRPIMNSTSLAVDYVIIDIDIALGCDI